ncbi:MAG: divalent-cation tolerance protein CutA [Verrucomicrobiota bacterium]
MSDVRLVLCTFPDVEKAREIGTKLVEERLAACVNLVPGVESIYRWQGQVESSAEVLGIFKTTADGWTDFEARLRELHPYEVPEIIAVAPEKVTAAYAMWVGEEVGAQGG